MEDLAVDIAELEAHIRHLKTRKSRNGTKIYYAEKRLEQLRAGKKPKAYYPRPKKPAQKKPPVVVKPRVNLAAIDRAFVLHQEVYDLTQAMVALEKLRRIDGER